MTTAGDLKAGDVVREDNGYERVIASIEHRGWDGTRERLWVHSAHDGAAVIGRQTYWATDGLYRNGAVVTAGP